jgi:hypothetical protein
VLSRGFRNLDLGWLLDYAAEVMGCVDRVDGYLMISVVLYFQGVL